MILDDDKSYQKKESRTWLIQREVASEILNTMVRVGSIEEAFEQSLDGVKEVSHMDVSR